MEKHSFITVLSKFNFHSVRIVKLLLSCDNEGHTLDITTYDSADWGVPSTLDIITKETFSLPMRLEIRWITLLEGKCFEISESLDQTRAEELWEKQEQDFPNDPFRQYIIGIAPYGGVAVWLCSDEKSVLLHWLQAEEKPLTEEEMKVHSSHPEMERITNSRLPLKTLQSNMRQYRYRFVPLEEYFDGEKWRKYDNDDSFYEEIALDGVEVKRLDGTFDYSDNENLMRYHKAGKPQRIMVRWQEGKASYLAHFWLDESVATLFFDSLFNAFPDACADLLLRIDTRANRYELAITGSGLPIRKLKNTQYVVFRDNTEISRSSYFTKKDGDWFW